MVISLFVLFVCSLAVDGLNSKFPPQTQRFVPHSFTTDMAFRGSNKVKSDVAITLCGDNENHCAAFGHPV